MLNSRTVRIAWLLTALGLAATAVAFLVTTA